MSVQDSKDCECLQWPDVRSDIRFLTGHHENCPNRGDITEAAKQLISELVRGIELWGAEEEGVFKPCWEPYKRAKAVLGQFDWTSEPIAPGLLDAIKQISRKPWRKFTLPNSTKV